ncbi:MAG: chromate efflux transporter [Dehalococcoidales bacterium]
MKNTTSRERLKEVALLFLRLGATAFGGAAAYIAIMQRETVRKRGWLDDQKFLDMLGISNLIPGPTATEMALYIGLEQAGWLGYLSAGLLFIIPGMLATIAIAWAYVKYASLPAVGWILYGVKPVIIAIVIQALWDLGKKGVKGPLTAFVGAAAIAAYLFGLNAIAVLFAGAAIVLFFQSGKRFWPRVSAFFLLSPFLPLKIPELSTDKVPFKQTTLFLTFLKIGALIYGGGYVLFAFINSEFVSHLGWLTHQQLLDAIAVGQITPGPVFSSATFVGYLMGGWQSALLATLAIFLPAFFFVALASRILPSIRKAWWAGALLDGVNVSALGLMAAVTWQLGRTAIIDWFTIALMILTLVLVLRVKINSTWLILGGALAGVAYKFLIR